MEFGSGEAGKQKPGTDLLHVDLRSGPSGRMNFEFET